MGQDSGLDAGSERNAIDRERTATGDPRLGRRVQHDAAPPAPEQAHLGLEQAVRVDGFDRFERVAADKLGEALRLMRGRHLARTHLV